MASPRPSSPEYWLGIALIAEITGGRRHRSPPAPSQRAVGDPGILACRRGGVEQPEPPIKPGYSERHQIAGRLDVEFSRDEAGNAIASRSPADEAERSRFPGFDRCLRLLELARRDE
jgi:hypothetical protein